MPRDAEKDQPLLTFEQERERYRAETCQKQADRVRQQLTDAEKTALLWAVEQIDARPLPLGAVDARQIATCIANVLLMLEAAEFVINLGSYAKIESTNHDAAPAARADSTDERPPNAVSANGGTPSAASRSGSGTGGTTREPVAWLVLDADGAVWDVFLDADDARSCALDGVCVPLYRDSPPPTLTDAEREAVVWAIAASARAAADGESGPRLRGLLARLGGEA